MRPIAVPGRDDDAFGAPRRDRRSPGSRLHPARPRGPPRPPRPAPRRSARVRLEVADHLAPRHEPVRIRAAVGEAGEPRLPAGVSSRSESQLGAPALGDATALEHHVIHAARLQATARGEPLYPPPTTTTSVRFMASLPTWREAAGRRAPRDLRRPLRPSRCVHRDLDRDAVRQHVVDRRPGRDCATISSSFSAGASPLIRKLAELAVAVPTSPRARGCRGDRCRPRRWTPPRRASRRARRRCCRSRR